MSSGPGNSNHQVTGAFDRFHPGFAIDQKRNLLMKDPNVLKSALSASMIKSPKCVRSELRSRKTVFRPISTDELMRKLNKLPSWVTREEMSPARRSILSQVNRLIASIGDKPQSVHHSFNEFMSAASFEVQRILEYRFRNESSDSSVLVGTRGILDKQKGCHSSVDSDAGLFTVCENTTKFGSPVGNGERLLVSLCKYFRRSPTRSTWFAEKSNVLAELLCQMFGAKARLGLYVTNFGMKLLLLEPSPEGGGLYEAFVWDESIGKVCFSDKEKANGIIDVFSEILRLSMREVSSRAIFTLRSDTVAWLAEDARSSQAWDSRDARSRYGDEPRDFRYLLKTTTSEVVEIWSMDMAARFSNEEKEALIRLEKKRRDAREVYFHEGYSECSDSDASC